MPCLHRPSCHAIMGVLPSTQPVATLGSSFILSSFDVASVARVGLVKCKPPFRRLMNPHFAAVIHANSVAWIVCSICNEMNKVGLQRSVACAWHNGVHLNGLAHDNHANHQRRCVNCNHVHKSSRGVAHHHACSSCRPPSNRTPTSAKPDAIRKKRADRASTMPKACINGTPIKNVSDFRHLGTQQEANASTDFDVHTRLNLARVRFNGIYCQPCLSRQR